MEPDSLIKQPSVLTGVTLRYPEKTFYLGNIFKDTTNSYKLVWFLALLSVLERGGNQELRLKDIFTEMIVAAWHPVCLFRLSLGRLDKLQEVIMEIQRLSSLPSNATSDDIRRFVEGSTVIQDKLDFLKRYVPTRFLTPWFNNRLRGMKDTFKDERIISLSRASQMTPLASIYYFDESEVFGYIKMNDSWRAFLLENYRIVRSFAEYHFALYLQNRNPNVPGVVNKLRAPTARQLTAARDFWRFVRTEFTKAGKATEFCDIYSERQLGDNFSIDHFLPWSFVVHDLLWNLTPVDPVTNSSKNDLLPDLQLYLPRLAKLHFAAVGTAKKRPKLLEDYTDCFKQDIDDLLTLGESGFISKYREVIEPQVQIARNQGFQYGWKLRN